MSGPSGFFCRWCGAYQTTRTRTQCAKAREHTSACHIARHGKACSCDVKS